MTIYSLAPQTSQALLERAQQIAGLTFAEVANELNIQVPENLRRNKGWVGMLIETALGAQAGSKAEQDFAHLGIELKTIPINHLGEPLETTFVSLAPLNQTSGVTWRTSHVYHKLQQVLWIPVQGEREIPLAQRHIGAPILWQPSEDQERRLAQDWEELMDLIVLGRVREINARLGEVMQLRPKGANSRSITQGYDEEGNIIDTLPLGFYLRKSFTTEILQQFMIT